MQSSTKYLAGPLLGALLTVGLLAGCSTSNDAATPAPSPTTSATAPEPTPEPVVAAPGQTISPEQAAELPEGQVAYPLPDGTHVVVDADAPLPEAVHAQMTAEATAAIGAAGVADGFKVLAAGEGFAESASKATGKNVVVIYVNPMSSFGDEEPHPIWRASGPTGSIVKATLGRDDQIANVEAFIAAQPDPAQWTYVVQNA